MSVVPLARAARKRRSAAVGLLLAAACTSVAGPRPDDPGGSALFGYQLVGGDQQVGPEGAELPVPLRIRLADRSGAPVANRALRWAVASGSGTLLDASGTDGQGFATARLRLGASGALRVTVRVDGDDAAGAFAATAVTSAYPAPLVEVAVPPNYGIHDTFVRDGIAFVCAWNSGIIIYDVGDGRKGGSPSHPVEISRIVPSDNGVAGGPAVHNAWWFHNRVTGEKRYLFVGQEGPARLFSSSSGDIHVLDVSDLASPREVASLRVPNAGTHNFWMDEAGQVLYAAYYNGGVVKLDVSGTLAGDLSGRVRARELTGGPDSTFVWGVQLSGGALWASDIVSGFWQLDPETLRPIAGGRNVPERWGSDLWVHGAYAYTGTWGGTPRDGTGFGDVVKIWRLSASGPTLVDSLKVPNIRTVSDLQASDDGRLLVLTTERQAGQGLSVYDLADPARPAARGSSLVDTGLHTGTVARIGGRLYVFAAKNPPNPALKVYDITP
jgi:hypothetical protein